MEIRIRGSVEEIGDQVAALDKLFRPGEVVEIRTGLPALVSTEPAASPSPAGTSGPGVPPDDVARLELDVDSQPWNGAIHSSNRSRKKDGRWTIRRGADKARVAVVYAEWTAGQAQTQPPPPPLPALGDLPFTPPGGTAPVAPPISIIVQNDPPPAGPAASPPPPAPVAEDPLTGCIRVAAAIMALTDDPGQKAVIGARVNAIMTQSGLPGGSMPALQANPQFAPTVLAGLQALAAELGVQC